MLSETEGHGSFDTLGCYFENWTLGTVGFEIPDLYAKLSSIFLFLPMNVSGQHL